MFKLILGLFKAMLTYSCWSQYISKTPITCQPVHSKCGQCPAVWLIRTSIAKCLQVMPKHA